MVAIGFVLSQEQFPVPQLLEYGVAAERAGFDAVWTSDHFLPWMDNQGHAGQAWVTMAALGQRMPRIPMGTGVTCPSYRYNPAIVAQSFSTLSQLYPGRIFLGVGTGEAINEQTTTADWGDHDERAERMIEAVQLIRELWTGQWVHHHGKYFQLQGARLYDTPKEPVPIYIAGSGKESVKLAGQYGDGWISDAESAVDPEFQQAFREGVQSSGKNPRNMPIIAESFVHVGAKEDARYAAQMWRFIPEAFTKFVNNPDPRDILRQAEAEIPLEKVIEKWTVSPDPKVHIQKIQELADNGVTHVFIHSGQQDQRKVIDFYANQVLPQIKHGEMQAGV